MTATENDKEFKLLMRAALGVGELRDWLGFHISHKPEAFINFEFDHVGAYTRADMKISMAIPPALFCGDAAMRRTPGGTLIKLAGTDIRLVRPVDPQW